MRRRETPGAGPQAHLPPLLDGASYRPSKVLAFEDEPQAQAVEFRGAPGRVDRQEHVASSLVDVVAHWRKGSGWRRPAAARRVMLSRASHGTAEMQALPGPGSLPLLARRARLSLLHGGGRACCRTKR